MNERELTVAWLALSDAACPHCRHPLRALPSPVCPECGSEAHLMLRPRAASSSAWCWAASSAAACAGLFSNWFGYAIYWWFEYRLMSWQLWTMTGVLAAAFALSIGGFALALKSRAWFERAGPALARRAAWAAGASAAALNLAVWLAWALLS